MTPELRRLQRLAVDGNLSWITPKERAVVILRLGWDRPSWEEGRSTVLDPRSQQEVADHLGISQAYVSHLERSAKARLSECLASWKDVRSA